MARTNIFADRAAFLARADLTLNGVTQAFADAHPGWGAERGNTGCWGCSDCSDCSDCSRCSRCSDCSGCWGCSDCSDCSDEKDRKAVAPSVPVIPNIHQRIYALASQPNALNMGAWHTCETTHCRAGWVTHEAGEAGRALEAYHGTALAALLIYRASSPIKVTFPRFYETDAVAMADMQRCAEAEATRTGASNG